jgi:nucleotide-binding universal stress UspA family protein
VEDTLARGEKVLDEAETVVRSVAPDVAVERRLVGSSAAQAILDTAVPGSLIVLGRRRLGAVARVVDGSVTVRVAAHARGPVVVVGADTPGRSGRSGVVVGVDGSEQSQAAVRFAMQAAALLGTHVTAVTAWNHPVWTHPVYLEPPETIRGRARKRLLATVDEARGDFPDVPVRIKLTRGYAADALVADSRSAQMVVVGSRGRGAVEGLLLGSVGQTLLHRAESPVVVVPAEGARERRTAA